MMKSSPRVLAALLLAGCASYSGRGLIPGSAELDEVLRVMGQPAMRWDEPDGSVRLAFPRSPEGVHTFMVRIGPDGKLLRIDNALDEKGFSQIRAGMSEAQVLQVLGPPHPGGISYFKARSESAWDWRYCDNMYNVARFSVLFDAASRTVRGTTKVNENCGQANCACTR